MTFAVIIKFLFEAKMTSIRDMDDPVILKKCCDAWSNGFSIGCSSDVDSIGLFREQVA